MQELRYPAHRDCTADGLQLQKSGTQRQPNPLPSPTAQIYGSKVLFHHPFFTFSVMVCIHSGGAPSLL